MEIVVAGILVILLGFLLWGLLRNQDAGKGRTRRQRTAQEDKNGGFAEMADWKAPQGRNCPLCHHDLKKGETVKTKLTTIVSNSRFKQAVRESASEVYGCPWCWPANGDYPRICPVCRETLGGNDLVIGRYFEKEGSKNHLHVLGCTRCRTGR